MTYEEFLKSKEKAHVAKGIKLGRDCIAHVAHDFQKDVTLWALAKGCACIFGDTGTGKTLMQVEFARHISDGVRLIVAPLGVTEQTIGEACLHNDLQIKRANSDADIRGSGVYITNYERLDKIETHIDAIVLDESSILKSFDGAYRKYIQERFAYTPYKLACTATPAPNDYMELGTHSEFVGALTRQEMLATYFCHDGSDTSKWRIKKHATGDFWRWVSTWAATFRHPRDLGYEIDGYDLPPCEFFTHMVDAGLRGLGGLFGESDSMPRTGPRGSAITLHQMLRDSANERVDKVCQLVKAEIDRPWLIWCHANDEQDMIEECLPMATSVRGSTPIDLKIERLSGFATGKYPILITKGKIAGQGLNFQRCCRMAFCGVTYSFEQVYQCVRRCWRYGQKNPVHAHIVICEGLESVNLALDLKQKGFDDMASEIRKYTGGILR